MDKISNIDKKTDNSNNNNNNNPPSNKNIMRGFFRAF